MKNFKVPVFYQSSIIKKIKSLRKELDPKKKDFTPTILDFGPVQFHLARHFGFCYGVENAIEISYQAIEENPNKKIYLLSQMIHNPVVNEDLLSRGLKFIQDTEGNQLISWDEITENDVVITPAFGTTIEISELLKKKMFLLKLTTLLVHLLLEYGKKLKVLVKMISLLSFMGKALMKKQKLLFPILTKMRPLSL